MEQDRILPAALSIWRTTSAIEDGKNVLKFEIRDDRRPFYRAHVRSRSWATRARSGWTVSSFDPGDVGPTWIAWGKWMESKSELIETVLQACHARELHAGRDHGDAEAL
jgi:hypothetical protein